MKRVPFRLPSFAQGSLSLVEWLGWWLFHIAAGVSSLLFLITLFLWVHSHLIKHIYSDTFRRNTGYYKFSVQTRTHDNDFASGPGLFGIEIYPQPDRWAEQAANAPQHQVFQIWTDWPLQGRFEIYDRGGRWYFLIGSLYRHVAIVTAVLPAVWLGGKLRKERVRRRSKSGQCAVCGYDLRASPERCPECGEVPRVEGKPATLGRR